MDTAEAEGGSVMKEFYDWLEKQDLGICRLVQKDPEDSWYGYEWKELDEQEVNQLIDSWMRSQGKS